MVSIKHCFPSQLCSVKFIFSSDGTPLIRISHPSYDELAPDAQRAVDAIEFITENMKDDETTKQVG